MLVAAVFVVVLLMPMEVEVGVGGEEDELLIIPMPHNRHDTGAGERSELASSNFSKPQ